MVCLLTRVPFSCHLPTPSFLTSQTHSYLLLTMPTTEIATVPLVAGSKPGDPSDPSAAILKETFNTLQQQDGMQQIHFGLLEENPDVLQMMISASRPRTNLERES